MTTRKATKKSAAPTRKKSAAKAGAKRASGPACELCGKRGEVKKTDCCGRTICDDEAGYVMFSYSRNSCDRNHRRYTLCGFHFHAGHGGRWQDCAKCRAQFETEIYVSFGTNEYNFEKLENPPAFEPTLCAKCKSRIDLGKDGYTMKGDAHYCMRCFPM